LPCVRSMKLCSGRRPWSLPERFKEG
jgi:hypothetical protein